MITNYIERDLIIEINKKIIEAWNKRHPEQPEFIGVSINRIDKVLDIVKRVGNDLDYCECLIVKAAHLIGGLAWAQAFSGANKRTAMLSGSVFLNKNRLRLELPSEQYGELRKLLFEIQEERERLNPKTMEEIILYIQSNVVIP